MKKLFKALLILSICLIILILSGYCYLRSQSPTTRIDRIRTWRSNPAAHPDWQVHIGERCGNAPMLVPTTGFIGVGWGDGAPPLYRHTGYDIFSPDGADNVTPIIAAYDGYLTRESTWLSAVIIRHPNFPEFAGMPSGVAGSDIWTYYTHMASADGQTSYIAPEFPPGTYELFVEAGTLLGYQGTWSGNPERPTGLHLHFSIATSLPEGGYANETQIENTYDPMPFLGLTADEDGTIKCLAN
jgi:murein DD-endopeptidase MepM/ murein hydrolase activator NlpD